MRPADTAGAILNRVMNLKTYVVEVALPEEFEFNGTVPYDLTIKDGIVRIEIPALNEKEAVSKAQQFLNA
jgi:MinD superfamily P-loop ATPase